MKIGILTFHCAINYGAALQAFALKEYLQSLGHETYVVDYRPVYHREKARMSLVEFAKHIIRESLFYPVQTTRIARNRAFNAFFKNCQNLAPQDVIFEENDFDAFVFGSDQIWNPEISVGFDDVFFGHVTGLDGKRKIAYAASSGNHLCFSTKEQEYLRKSLSDFTAIGVRETSLKNALESFGISAIQTIDPVLLAESYIFDRIAKMPEKKKPYILLFQVGRVDGLQEKVQELAAKNNLDVVEAIADYEALRNPYAEQTLSPTEFLGYLKKASFVVTTSFHGTALSLVLHKDFFTISVNPSMNDRAQSLLNSCNLGSRLIEVSRLEKLDPVDFSDADPRVGEIRESSRQFLINALSNNE